MALLERVTTLLRANLNDIIDRAEDPLRMMNQVILDMENQSLQVKTQVAIAIADHHLLEKKRQENLGREADWMRKAERALEQKDEELARAAIQRSLANREIARSFEEQLADQKTQIENLKSALHKLDLKTAEARTQAELLKTRHRQARVSNQPANGPVHKDGVEQRLAELEKQDEIERLLSELKSKRPPG
jgi:phage shock protein A